MAKKKKNSILEEQRRARAEYIKLKKMQQGEIKAGPKPSETAVVPMTFKEKRENFWFHYKWYVIGIAFAIAAFVLLVAQCMSIPNYDFNVIYFSYTPAIDRQTDLIADYFEKYGEDINGDGEVQVQILNCSFSNEPGDIAYRNSQLQKLQAFITGEYKAMLYITDKESIKYFNTLDTGDKGLFDGEPIALNDEFYKMTTLNENEVLPEGLEVSCRRLKDTIMEDNKTAKSVHKEATRIIKELEKMNPKTETIEKNK